MKLAIASRRKDAFGGEWGKLYQIEALEPFGRVREEDHCAVGEVCAICQT